MLKRFTVEQWRASGCGSVQQAGDLTRDAESREDHPHHPEFHAPPAEKTHASRNGELNCDNLKCWLFAVAIKKNKEIMPTFYKIDKERRVVLTSGSGRLTLADSLAHQNRLLNDPDFDPTFSQIADYTQFTQFDLSANDIRQLAERSVFSPQSRRALIVPNDFAFGLGRMFQILRDIAGEQGIGVFRNLEEALDWVLSRSTSP
jgi:hypothetical protein